MQEKNLLTEISNIEKEVDIEIQIARETVQSMMTNAREQAAVNLEEAHLAVKTKRLALKEKSKEVTRVSLNESHAQAREEAMRILEVAEAKKLQAVKAVMGRSMDIGGNR